MNRDELEKRLAELRKTLEQIQANGNAVIGAIQECEFWLKKLDEIQTLENLSKVDEV